MSTKVFGIDLGTSNSACAVVDETGKIQVAVNANGNYTTPSVVLFKEDGERVVGDAAKRQAVMNPKTTVNFIKRFMGSEYKDEDVQKMIKMAAYDVVDENGKPRVSINGKKYSAEEISSHIVTAMKKVAEDYYGEEVTKCVITCPAFFNDAQRQATKLAGELAGLEVLRVINEPTAAILASDLDSKEDKKVAVVDLGGGTYDVSIVEISNVDGQTMYEVLASWGDVFLGGQNYDNAIVDWIADEFLKENGIDLRKDQMAYSRIVSAAEKAKIELSNSVSTDINEPYITVRDNQPLMLNMTLTRAKFEEITDQYTTRMIELTREAIKKANVEVEDLDCFLLVGGSTRIPSVQKALTDAFNRPLNKSVNPDQAVAIGACVQANNLVGGKNAKDILLLDVTPLSLGIETEGGIMTRMIESGTTIPTEKTDTFSTAEDNQAMVMIKVLQGERPMAADNKCIGTFMLEGIPPMRRGLAQIEVKYSIDASGILSVSAKEKTTGKEQKITISNPPLADDEIERIKREAEENKEADEARKKEIEELNGMEGMAYAMRSSLTDESLKDQFSEEEVKTTNEKVDAVLDAVKAKDVEKARAAQEELKKYFEPIIQRAYQAKTEAQQATENVANQTTSPDIQNEGTEPVDVQAEEVPFEEVKE